MDRRVAGAPATAHAHAPPAHADDPAVTWTAGPGRTVCGESYAAELDDVDVEEEPDDLESEDEEDEAAFESDVDEEDDDEPDPDFDAAFAGVLLDDEPRLSLR